MSKRPSEIAVEAALGAAAPRVKRGPRTMREVEMPTKPVKYTLLLDPATAVLFDTLSNEARTYSYGRAITKSDLFRAMLTVMADDGSVKENVFEEAIQRKLAKPSS